MTQSVLEEHKQLSNYCEKEISEFPFPNPIFRPPLEDDTISNLVGTLVLQSDLINNRMKQMNSFTDHVGNYFKEVSNAVRKAELGHVLNPKTL